MNDLNVCLYPMDITWGNKEENFRKLKETLSKVHPDTDLLVIPETFSTGFPAGMDKEHVREFSEWNSGDTVALLKRLAKEYNIAIAGSFVANTGGSLFNRGFFIEPGDETFADKRHLFTMAGEHKVFSPGYDRLKVRYRGWNIAMVICYDIRFPVWCRNSGNDYDLLLAVANWPEVRVDAWNKLLIARAIENEAYVCGVDCKGTDNGGFSYDGSSCVVDFKGKVTAGPQTNDDGLIYARLSMEKLRKFREKFPAWNDADPFTLEI